jgi:hypothetical protein
LPRVDPNTLPLPGVPNPDVDVLPNPNPEAGLSPDRPPKPLVVIVDVELADFAPASEPKPDVDEFPPKTLGLDAPITPNGEVLDAARELKPELAKAEADVCGLSLKPLPNASFGEDTEDFLDVSESADVVLFVSWGSTAAICYVGVVSSCQSL